MQNKTTITLILVILLTFALASVAQAAVTKYTFNDVVIDEEEGTIVEITASVKTTNKGDYSVCTYFTDDYREVLGYYQAAVSAGSTADAVEAFCVENFAERTQ